MSKSHSQTHPHTPLQLQSQVATPTPRRVVKVINIGNSRGKGMFIPVDVLELLRIDVGDMLMITAHAEGWMRVEKADTAQ